MVDFIGDIHGHADELEALLQKMGYSENEKGYSHPERKVIFLGDYIDRGPKIKRTLEIVKAMTDSDNAVALMGNHEFNAICFHTKSKKGGYVRNHSIKNIMQHFKTLKEFKNNQSGYEMYIEWFKTLPLFVETDSYRAVHAYWDRKTIDYLKSILTNNRLTDSLIEEAGEHGTELFYALENTLKGKEITLPKGHYFHDKDGFQRKEIRIKWWENLEKMTYRSFSVISMDELPDTPIEPNKMNGYEYYSESEIPVFFGHYWLAGKPELLKRNVCCLDYSVAKNGKLAAYRMGNMKKLNEQNLIFV